MSERIHEILMELNRGRISVSDAYDKLCTDPVKAQMPCEECKWNKNRGMFSGLGSDYPCDSCRTDKWESIDAAEREGK